MPTRIAHVVENLNQGGIARVVIPLALEMCTLNVRADILTLDSRIQYTLAEPLNVRQVDIVGLTTSPPYSRIVRRLGYALIGRRAFWHFTSRWFCKQMERYTSKIGYDCVFFHGLPVCWPFHRWGQPNGVFVLHSIKSLQVSADSSWCEYQLYKKTFLQKQFVAVSDAVRRDAIANFPVDPTKIETINNPFDFESIASKSRAPISMPLPRDSYFVFVGRLAREKRIDLLMRAFKKVNVPEHLLILGQGPLQLELTQLAEQLSITGRVHFMGFVENPYPYMRQAKALVLPSDFEGFGLVIIEALATGTSVISTRIGPAEEILIGPLAAGLFDIGDEAGLVTKLREASQGRLPVIHPEFLLRFDKRIIAEKYLNFADRMLAKQI